MKKLILFTDGGSRGNPGPAAIGAVVYSSEGDVKETISRYIGETTNNQAEYQALFAGLQACQVQGAEEINCYLDSELLVRQLNGQYKVKDPGLTEQYHKVQNELRKFNKVTFTHVPREKNKLADQMVNEALDQQKKN